MRDLFLNREGKRYYDVTYPNEFPIHEALIEKMGKAPSVFHFKSNYKPELLDEMYSSGFKLVGSVKFERYSTEKMVFYNATTFEIFEIDSRKDSKDKTILYVKLLYDISHSRYSDPNYFTEHGIKKYMNEEKNDNSINLIVKTPDGLGLQEFELESNNLNIRDNYGEDFVKIHDDILERLNTKNDKGIVLLYGDPGSGKTTFLRYLANKIKDKDLIFVPPALSECISDPEMIPFLMDHKNSILIIEDGEKVIGDRQSSTTSSTGVSNVLNLTDGILSDCLNIQIIVTFNMPKELIDPALLRKGRLIAEHKFGPLSLEDTRSLLKKLDKDQEVKEGMLVSDIYNIDKVVYKTESKKIGFN